MADNPKHAYLLKALRDVAVAERLTRMRRDRLRRLVDAQWR